jgi:hypothetical protein
MSHYLVDQLATRANVRVLYRTEVAAAYGDTSLEAIDVVDNVTGETTRLESSGLFIFIGADAETAWLPPEIALDPKGYVLTGADVRAAGRWELDRDPYLLETSVPAVNSALQRARATLAADDVAVEEPADLDADAQALLARYVEAFERYDIDALTTLIHEDATQSMPPFDLWLAGRDDIFTWWWGPGIGCKGSRVVPAGTANGSPAFGQYKPSESGDGYEPWALQVVELEDGKIVELTFFLDTETLFPLFGLPLQFTER